MKLKKKSTKLSLLIKAAEKEMFQFNLNEMVYTVDSLISLGLSEKIPNLVQLNKLTNGVKILNVGGIPVLHLKHSAKSESYNEN